MTRPIEYRDDEWWRDHYSGALLDLWTTIVPPEKAREDADFLIERCGLAPGMAVLDVPCGQGRVAIELAARGMEVTGIDIAPGQIALAQAAARERGLAIDFRVGDMRALPPGPFDAAFCWGDSFGYMDDAGNAAFLTAVHGALKPGGRFAIEMEMLAEVLEPRFTARAEGRAGDFDVRIERDWNRAAGRMAVTYRLTRSGQTETSRASFRIHTGAEMRSLLETAGFVIELFGNRAGDPLGPGSDCLRAVARAAH